MKKIIITILSLTLLSAGSIAAELPSAIEPAAEQSAEDINAAALAQISKELGLNSKQLNKLEPIYKEYRAAMAKAVDTEANNTATDEASQRRQMKAKLSNISAVAEIKRTYVDRFATILTAEQIRTLYNAEGAIGTSIKRSLRNSYNVKGAKRIEGSSRIVSQDFGAAGNYSTLAVNSYINVVVSATAHTITVKANDNIIDLVKVERENGILKIGLENARCSLSNISISAVVPASANLSSISASGYSTIKSNTPVKGKNMTVNVNGGSEVKADISGLSVKVNVSGYGKFEGTVTAEETCEYTVSGGAAAIGDIECTTAKISISGYGKLNGNIDADIVTLGITGGAKLNGDIDADTLNASLSGYGSATGAISTDACDLRLSGGSSLRSTLNTDTFTASATGYGKIILSEGKADTGTVRLDSGSSFSAPNVTVTTYTITASGYAKADVNCTATLKVNTASGAKVNYSGNCRVETNNPNVKKVQ